jgi:probable F420-dependent oxidoreductase
MSARPFRFGVGGPRTMSSRELAETARTAEALGYSTFVFPDHFADQLAPVPAIMAAAAATTALRVGSMVFNGDFRHPVVLAKEAATLDLLSDGRLEIALGAGWMQSEYDAAGLTLDPTAMRVERLGETIEIMRRLLGDGPCTFEGRHFTVRGLDGLPKPVQRPHPPILVGGGGARILSLAAREANIVGLAPQFTPPERYGPRTILADATARKLNTVREAAGARFDELEINTYPAFGQAQVTSRAREVLEEMVQRLRRRYPQSPVTEDELMESPHVLVGTVESLVEKLRGLRERFAISYVRIGYDAMEPFAPVVEELAGR